MTEAGAQRPAVAGGVLGLEAWLLRCSNHVLICDGVRVEVAYHGCHNRLLLGRAIWQEGGGGRWEGDPEGGGVGGRTIRQWVDQEAGEGHFF